MVRNRWMVDRVLWLYALLVLALNGLSWGSYIFAGEPALLRPLFDANDQHRDLTSYVTKISHLDQGAAALAHGLPIFNYPAPAAYVYAFLLRGFPAHPWRAYVEMMSAGLACGAFLLWKTAQARRLASWGFIAAVVTTATLGFPVVFLLDRGNIEGIVGLVLAVGLVLLVCKRFYPSAIFVGLAASIKPFPGFFLLLLLRRKLYREFAVGAVTAALSVVIALTALGPTPWRAYQGLQPGVKDYIDNYIMTVPPSTEGRFDHSSLDAIKSVTNQASMLVERMEKHGPGASFLFSGRYSQPAAEPTAGQTAHMRALVLVSTVVEAMGLVYALSGIFKLPGLNQLLLVGTAITLFVPLAAEYTLIHLYVPFGLFLLFLVRDVGTGSVEFKRGRAICLLIFFALLFSPLSFLGRNSGNFKTLVLLSLVIASRRWAMPSSLFDELGGKVGEQTMPALKLRSA